VRQDTRPAHSVERKTRAFTDVPVSLPLPEACGMIALNQAAMRRVITGGF
jgi:hypothetical protein